MSPVFPASLYHSDCSPDPPKRAVIHKSPPFGSWKPGFDTDTASTKMHRLSSSLHNPFHRSAAALLRFPGKISLMCLHNQYSSPEIQCLSDDGNNIASVSSLYPKPGQRPIQSDSQKIPLSFASGCLTDRLPPPSGYTYRRSSVPLENQNIRPDSPVLTPHSFSVQALFHRLTRVSVSSETPAGNRHLHRKSESVDSRNWQTDHLPR